MVANVFNASTLALGRLRQANLDEFEANLMFLASSRNEIMSQKKKDWVLVSSQTCFVNFPTFCGLSFYCFPFISCGFRAIFMKSDLTLRLCECRNMS